VLVVVTGVAGSGKSSLIHGSVVDGPENSRNPLGEAARAGYCRPSVKLLLIAGADPDYIGQLKQSALEVCLQEHNMEGAEELLKAGANPNNPGPENGARLLVMAASDNNTALVKRLLDLGADPTLPGNHHKQNALQAAAMLEHLDPALWQLLSDRKEALEKQRNMAGVENNMAAVTAAAIFVKPIKLRLH